MVKIQKFVLDTAYKYPEKENKNENSKRYFDLHHNYGWIFLWD